MPTAETNGPFSNRVVLNCAPLHGPFASALLGQFDPRRDLQIYVDGDLLNIVSFSFDQANNRYLMFADRSFNLQGIVQVIHHMPNPPFVTVVNPVINNPLFAQDPGEGGGS